MVPEIGPEPAVENPTLRGFQFRSYLFHRKGRECFTFPIPGEAATMEEDRTSPTAVRDTFRQGAEGGRFPAVNSPWSIEAGPAGGFLRMEPHGRTYRVVRWETLGPHFQLGLLGALYENDRRKRDGHRILKSVEREAAGRGRYHLLVHSDGEPGQVPMATLLEDARGDFHVVEIGFSGGPAGRPVFLEAMKALSEGCLSPSRCDAYGDFLALGGHALVERHSTERSVKHLSRRVLRDTESCNHCLRCLGVCNEMQALASPESPRLLGPAGDFCTNCGLCRLRCPYLAAVPKEGDVRDGFGRRALLENGAGVLCYGNDAAAFLAWLEDSDEGLGQAGLEIERAFDFSACSPQLVSADRQFVLRWKGVEKRDSGRGLTATFFKEGGELRVLFRREASAGVVFQTRDGGIEAALVRSAVACGFRVLGTAAPVSRGSTGRPPGASGSSGAAAMEVDLALPCNETTRALGQAGLWSPDSLDKLWERGAVDFVLAPYSDELPAAFHEKVLKETGRTAHVLAPHLRGRLPRVNGPQVNRLGDLLGDLFWEREELLSRERAVAAGLLSDIGRNFPLIHARYGPLAFASGHSACPSCAEAQVLAIPIVTAMAASLARGEAPRVTFTCETGCMSETLVKMNEVAQKTAGGRTVFGGGFAFGEAMALALDHAVRMGRLKKGRRYVVSQGGDGGATIGLPAWLNALRQQAALIRRRNPNVLHFITITDTQVYSNTGGESSATSPVGMGTLTTPIGSFLLGNQKIQWNLINLAAEFPGILVGMGHSGARSSNMAFWAQADRMGCSAMRWDVTPCPETGKFFGEDPDDLADVMAQAGMLPEVVFCGRYRKRVAPYDPADRGKPFEEWRRDPKPILYWLEKDRRYRPLLKKNPETGRFEARNLTAHGLIQLLETFRDRMNHEIDMETRLVRAAERHVGDFLDHLKAAWAAHRHRPEDFPYGFLFDARGRFKPEYDGSLERDLVLRVLGWEDTGRRADRRDRRMQNETRALEKARAALDDVYADLGRTFHEASSRSAAVDGLADQVERVQGMNRELEKALRGLETLAARAFPPDPVAAELFGPAGDDPVEDGRADEVRTRLFESLDRILEERSVGKFTELQQHRLSRKLKKDFVDRGGILSRPAEGMDSELRRRFRESIARFGPFAIGVASLAGDRGIAVNRVFAHFFKERGAWAGMAWQFGSSKRGTPVLSATFVDSRPMERKDAMYAFPMAVLAVTNFEEMKRDPDLFFGQLHPRGTLLINSPRDPESLWSDLVSGYPQAVREVASAFRERGGPGDVLQTAVSEPAAAFRKEIRERLEKERIMEDPETLGVLVDRVAAMVTARVVSVDMDGAMQRVTGSSSAVSNLVAVGLIHDALAELGLPLDWERDRELLQKGFPGAVLKNPQLIRHYLDATDLARRERRSWGGRWRGDRPGGHGGETTGAGPGELPLAERARSLEDPGASLMVMGGTLAGMVLSQLALPEHPLFYVGFPITPAGNPFYAMAEAYADGHPWIVVDEVNPSEKVAAEKLLGIARTGGFLPVTFTASQGWRLFTEVIPQFVGARLEGLFLLTRRALAAPNLNIEESHTDFMSFRDDGGIMIAPKSIQDYVPCLYLARLLTHFARLPVILSIGGITDTHKIGLVKVPPDEAVRQWLRETLRGFDFFEDKILNRRGETVVHGPSCTSATYQETQSELEKAHQAVQWVLPYGVRAVARLTGVRLDELEAAVAGEGVPEAPGSMTRKGPETLFVLQGSLYPNAVEALRELEADGWRGLACLSARFFNPFPEDVFHRWFEWAERIVVFDRSNSFGSVPPLASRVWTALARWQVEKGAAKPRVCRSLVGGLGGREVTVREMKDILLSTHLFFRISEPWERRSLAARIRQDSLLMSLLEETAALECRDVLRHTRVPEALRGPGDEAEMFERIIERKREALLQRNYTRFLANHNQVEFVGAKELLGASALHRRIVLAVESYLAGEALAEGRADWRRAAIWLEFGKPGALRDAAMRVLETAAGRGEVSRELAAHYGAAPAAISEGSPRRPDGRRRSPGAAPSGGVPNEGDGSGTAAGETFHIPLDDDETARIVSHVRRMVAAQAEEPLHFNPEDFEAALIDRLLEDEDSQLARFRGELCRLEPPGFSEGMGTPRVASGWIERDERLERLIWDYRCRYADVFDRTLQRELLVQHYAPELEKAFEGDGWKRLQVLAERLREEMREEPLDERREEILYEIERYLEERIFPELPKSPAFYLEYFRTWVAPTLVP